MKKTHCWVIARLSHFGCTENKCISCEGSFNCPRYVPSIVTFVKTSEAVTCVGQLQFWLELQCFI